MLSEISQMEKTNDFAHLWNIKNNVNKINTDTEKRVVVT